MNAQATQPGKGGQNEQSATVGVGNPTSGEQLAHLVEQARVRGQVRARRAADRLLVHAHEAAHVRQAAGDVADGRDVGLALEVHALLSKM